MTDKLIGSISEKQTISGKLARAGSLSGNIKKSIAALQGVIASAQKLTGKVQAANAGQKIIGSVSGQQDIFGNLATAYMIGAPYYEGAYEVTPATTAQELKTKHKQMTEDVQINAIPFFDVSNTSGGSTVYIGSVI